MKVILPKHREFLIRFEDGYAQEAEAWEALNQIVKDYSVDGKSVYSKHLLKTMKIKLRLFRKSTNLHMKLLKSKQV